MGYLQCYQHDSLQSRVSGTIALGFDHCCRQARHQRCLCRRIDERVGATDENVLWRARQATENLGDERGIDPAGVVAFPLWEIAR